MRLYMVEIQCPYINEWLVLDLGYSEIRAEAIALLAKLDSTILDARVTPLEPEML